MYRKDQEDVSNREGSRKRMEQESDIFLFVMMLMKERKR